MLAEKSWTLVISSYLQNFPSSTETYIQELPDDALDNSITQSCVFQVLSGVTCWHTNKIVTIQVWFPVCYPDTIAQLLQAKAQNTQSQIKMDSFFGGFWNSLKPDASYEIGSPHTYTQS